MGTIKLKRIYDNPKEVMGLGFWLINCGREAYQKTMLNWICG